MAQSLCNILVHLVFSTKNRQPIIHDDHRDELHAYVGGVIRNLDGTLLKAGSVQDHIHLLIVHPKTCTPPELVKKIKAESSKWIKTKSSRDDHFHWQSGYGMFTISPSHKKAVTIYIANQAKHHETVSFQDEFRRLLEKYQSYPGLRFRLRRSLALGCRISGFQPDF
jgi:REP-associated tyrosine transposase